MMLPQLLQQQGGGGGMSPGLQKLLNHWQMNTRGQGQVPSLLQNQNQSGQVGNAPFNPALFPLLGGGAPGLPPAHPPGAPNNPWNPYNLPNSGLNSPPPTGVFPFAAQPPVQGGSASNDIRMTALSPVGNANENAPLPQPAGGNAGDGPGAIGGAGGLPDPMPPSGGIGAMPILPGDPLYFPLTPIGSQSPTQLPSGFTVDPATGNLIPGTGRFPGAGALGATGRFGGGGGSPGYGGVSSTVNSPYSGGGGYGSWGSGGGFFKPWADQIDQLG